MVDPELRQFCTDRQWQVLEALGQEGSHRKAAIALGCARNVVSQVVKSVNIKAAARGYSPDHDMSHQTAPGFVVKGTSTLYGDDGQVKSQWVKTNQDQESQLEALRDAVEAMTADVPRMKPVAAPKSTDASLLNLYVITDFHMGMLAWRKEGGEDWDVKIATSVLTKTFSQMMAQSPEAETGFICQLGDFLHSDYPGMAGLTMSGHNLDTDGRPHKVIQATIDILRSLVDMALTKHKKVVVLMAEGNHDMVSSIWLQILFSALYEKDKRVEVIKSPLPYYCYQHGETSLFFHHGHLKKLPSLPGVFAAQFPSEWGQTKFRYAHAGHYHHKIRMDEKEDMGVTVTQHRTLSAKDAYSSRGGYFSEQKAECLTYKKDEGIVSSVHVSPAMIIG